MKLGHIVKYHDVFFKFDNGPYRTMLSVVMALCLWNFNVLNDVRSLSRILLIRILWNLVTLFSTLMSSSSLIMVYMAPCFKELLSLVLWKIVCWNDVCSLRWIVLTIILWNLVTLLSTIMSSSFRMAHIAFCLQELVPFVNDISLFMRIWQKRGHLCPMDTFLVFILSCNKDNHKAWMSLKFSRIWPGTYELADLEHLEKFP